RDDEHPQPHITLPERRLAARNIAKGAIIAESSHHRLHAGLDKVLLNPWAGPVILLALLFVIFQAVFAWATPFADAIDAGIGALIDLADAQLPAGFLRDLLTEGVLTGVGSVVVFLPQIVILFAFIL